MAKRLTDEQIREIRIDCGAIREDSDDAEAVYQLCARVARNPEDAKAHAALYDRFNRYF